MKHRIKTLSTAGILGILVWSPVALHGDPAQKDSKESSAATSESNALVSKDSHPGELFIVERLLTASPEQLARARTTIEKIEKMSEEEKKAALESIRKTLDERRRDLRNLTPEERQKLRNLSLEERQKMREERQQGAPRGPREQAEEGRRGPGPRGPQADRPDRPRRERPQTPPAAPQKEDSATKK